MPLYTEKLRKLGIGSFTYLPLPAVSEKEAAEKLKKSSGIIIGGGNTELYAEYIVGTSLGQAIQELYHNRCPIAGFSAGALLVPDHCAISSKDNDKKQL